MKLLFSSFLFLIFSRIHCVLSLEVIDNVTLEKGKPVTVTTNATEILFSHLDGVLYKESFSKLTHVTEILLGFVNLKDIEEGAVCSNPNIRTIRLWVKNANNRTITLKKEHFKNCDNLETLKIRGETSNNINEDVFDNLKNLESLYLMSVHLEYLNKRLFKGLSSLKKLTINHCSLKTLEADTFEQLTHLKWLDLFANHLKTLPPNIFKNLHSLGSLTLSYNEISGVTWDEFSGLSSLISLDVKNNDIMEFDTTKIAKHMPKLKVFAFQTKPLDCEKKKIIAKELKEKLAHDVNIIHTFDPVWFDPCEESGKISDNVE